MVGVRLVILSSATLKRSIPGVEQRRGCERRSRSDLPTSAGPTTGSTASLSPSPYSSQRACGGASWARPTAEVRSVHRSLVLRPIRPPRLPFFFFWVELSSVSSPAAAATPRVPRSSQNASSAHQSQRAVPLEGAHLHQAPQSRPQRNCLSPPPVRKEADQARIVQRRVVRQKGPIEREASRA